MKDASDTKVCFELTSADGDQGYPGTFTATATYSVIAPNRLRLEITATCDQPCPVNMTSHAYWNLSGAFDKTAADHVLQINADAWLPIDDHLIPLPGTRDVAGTGYDFRSAARVSDMLPHASQGFDHNFCLTGDRGTLRQIATLSDSDSGRSMKLFSTEAGLQSSRRCLCLQGQGSRYLLRGVRSQWRSLPRQSKGLRRSRARGWSAILSLPAFHRRHENRRRRFASQVSRHRT